MICEIIAVGTEILLGDILNTNARFLSQELSALGINVYYQSVVGDNYERLSESLKLALSRSDIVILSGGLGPTEDDITKETVADVLGMNLILDSESYNRIIEYFKGRNMSPTNKKQAMMPEGAVIMKNNNGTAPGCICEKNNKTVMIFPGPPNELIPMFLECAMPYLNEKTGKIIKSEFVKVFGVGESNAAYMLNALIDNQTNPTIAPYAKTTEAVFRVTASADNEMEADSLIEPVVAQIREIIGEGVYGRGEDTLESVTVRLLDENKLTISVAESCTGGLIASKICNVSGASNVFNESYVTYANSSKRKILGVSENTLAKFGAVSEQTALEMAEGVKKVSGADIGLSVTGIAGPSGGSDEKPVGLVYIGISYKNETRFIKLNLKGNRSKIREMAACYAINEVRKTILGGMQNGKN